MNIEHFVIALKITEHVLEIVMREYPEIITRAILETMKEG